MTDDLRARLALRALALRLRLKPEHVGSITGHARLAFPTGAVTDDVLDAWLLRARSELESHFEQEARVSPEAKLDQANAAIAEKRATAKTVAEQAKPKITLTPRELALPAGVRMAIYDEKMAAAIATQKKQPVTA